MKKGSCITQLPFLLFRKVQIALLRLFSTAFHCAKPTVSYPVVIARKMRSAGFIMRRMANLRLMPEAALAMANL